MRSHARKAAGRLIGPAAAVLFAAGVSACGSAGHATASGGAISRPPSSPTATTMATTTTTTTTAAALSGAGKPQVTIGDKNFTEQFVLGELYRQALQAQGYSVVLNRNIGPTDVTIPALASGRLDMYPEYLGTWDSQIAGETQPFATMRAAYRAGQRYALAHGLQLLDATPFSNTDAIGVKLPYAVAYDLHSLHDLRRVATMLTLGAPPQFESSPAGLPAIEDVYGFVPASFKPLAVGAQYQALDQGTVQAADVNTTDGQLATDGYKLLRDPRRVFGWGNVVPVVSAKTLLAEGPAFAQTINAVSALLTTPAMRRLNAAVDVSNQDPAAVAKEFLQAHGLLAPTTS